MYNRDMADPKTRVLLIDGYNMLHRSRSGWTKGDNPIIFNFFRSFRAVVDKFKPDITYFVLEGRPVKRLETMSEYKGQREYHDRDDFNRQRKWIIQTLKDRFPVRVVRHPNYECDDVLAALAVVRHPDADVTVVSSDTDFYQLLQTHKSLKLYNPVKKEFVQTPEYDYVTWKALRGDASDNIPGFKKIGDKRAADLVSSPESLSTFLLEPGNQELFDRNVSMIRFHDLTNEMQAIETHFAETGVDWETLQSEFNDMKFFSVTVDKSWDKFVRTFQHLS